MFPSLHLSVNGGITSLEQAQRFLQAGLDGVMIGRAAYHQPSDILGLADHAIFGEAHTCDPVQIVHQMLPYIEAHMISGGKLNQITRHMLGLFASKPGTRAWRRVLSERGHIGGPELVLEALSHVEQAQAA
jgi:tRNA-dihydrouridine synthase A